jgi:hypothetical protein
MTACLVAESGLATSLQQKVVRVGSDPTAEIPFAGIAGLAPWHFEITTTGQGHSIRKLQAQSLLLINGQPVTTAKLEDGDVITAGSLVLIYGSEVSENSEATLNMVTSPEGDEFVSRLVDAPVGTTHLHPKEMPEEPSLLAAVIAALVALLVTIIAYSFVCNFRWPFFICGTLALGHAVGRMFRVAGDGQDIRFGQFAALTVVAGVATVNSLTVAGIMNMYETVSEASIASVGSRNGDAPTSPEAEQSTLGTGQAALDVTSGSLVEIWQKLIPWDSISGKNARLIPVTGFSAIMLGPKSLVACLLMIITAYRAAFNSRPKTTVSTVAAAT